MTIPELIEKLKVADGPSRELDAEISPIVKGRARQISTFEQYEPSEVLPDFTGSIDAALTIGEEELKGGCWWLGHFDQRDRRFCCTMQRNSALCSSRHHNFGADYRIFLTTRIS